jgi:DNA-3-methyladenine glycosylase I
VGLQTGLSRCPWGDGNDLMRRYHDEEWGVPCHDDRTLFEFMVLEGAQAGLSWQTVLNKREGYRRAFADYSVSQIAAFGDADVARLMGDAGIIRTRAKVTATIGNARAALELDTSLDQLLWSFVDGTPVVGGWTEMGQVPATTPTSDAMSKALKKRGFRFVGSTICYSLMQACGLVNDHLVRCYRFKACCISREHQ